jgi:hypothetical protein
MPVIRFPSLAAVQSALAAQTVPPAVSRAPLQAGFDPAGPVWVRPAAPLPRNLVSALGRFGAAIHAESEIELTEQAESWLELVPLVAAPFEAADRPSPVLFDVSDTTRLPALVSELRRLSAGHVGIRWVNPAAGAREERAFLLVESPPFHSLVRSDPVVFASRGPRLWVEVGWRHLLAETIQPPPGQIALLRPPRSWEFVTDGPFASGPESFTLPARPADGEAAYDIALPARLRLAPDSAADPPELWVLSDRPFDQLRTLAEQSDDRLLSRLSVAIGSAGNRRVAIVRAIPGRGGPPVLVLDALACRPFLRLPNLFMPVGRRLRPPLRRDAVRRLLAPDAETVVWLEPGVAGSFTPHRLPESAFHPLDQFVEYVRDHELRPLTPVAGGDPFALPTFIARERPAPPPRRRKPTAAAETPAMVPHPESPAAHSGLISRIVGWFTPRHGEPVPHRRPAAGEPSVADEPPRSLDAREERRRALEEQLLAELGSSDGPGRPTVWPELARLYAAANRHGDAAVCWLNALWDADDPPPPWRRGWLQAEARTAGGDGTEDDLRRWLEEPATPASARAVAAVIAGSDPPRAARESLDRIQWLLDQHEDWLPVRSAWLARLGLGRLAGGDVVGLARARDRLLERLHDRGLSADLDVPAALRFAGQGAGERVDAVRGWLTRAREPIHRWLAARSGGAEGLVTGHDPRLQAFGLGTATAPTRAYADLILAWGLARLGERAACQDLLTQARGVLAPLDAAHNFLLDAFSVRIAEALEGRPGGPLPADLLVRLVRLREQERTDRAARERLLLVKVQHLLQHSRILEPAERVDAFSEGWLDPHAAEAAGDLAGLRYIADRDELANRLLPVVASAGRDPDRLPTVLATALDLAPRLGESVAGGILERLVGAVGSWTFAGPPERVTAEVTAVERGLFVAAHFDRAAAVQRLLASLGRLLEARRGGDPGESRPVEDALLNLVGQGLRGLRRLGLRAEADRLLDQLGEWVAPGDDLEAERRRRPQAWPLTLRRLLTLAGGWFYVGREAPAVGVLDEARQLLLSRELSAEPRRRQQTDLACAYAAALGHAPVGLALPRVEELFTRLHGVTDSLVTNTHYSLAKLRLVEAAVRAVVTDDFALGPAVRRWLDDDEYRVRRRIHRDTRAVLSAGDQRL